MPSVTATWNVSDQTPPPASILTADVGSSALSPPVVGAWMSLLCRFLPRPLFLFLRCPDSRSLLPMSVWWRQHHVVLARSRCREGGEERCLQRLSEIWQLKVSACLSELLYFYYVLWISLEFNLVLNTLNNAKKDQNSNMSLYWWKKKKQNKECKRDF